MDRDVATLDGGSCCSGFPLVFHQLKAAGAHSKVAADIHGKLDAEVTVSRDYSHLRGVGRL